MEEAFQVRVPAKLPATAGDYSLATTALSLRTALPSPVNPETWEGQLGVAVSATKLCGGMMQ